MKKKYILKFLVIFIFIFCVFGCEKEIENNTISLVRLINQTEEFYEGNETYRFVDCDLDYIKLDTIENADFVSQSSLSGLVSFARSNNITINNHWKVLTIFKDQNKDSGTIVFTYYINDIKTNKVVMFNFENGKYNAMLHKCINVSIDENKVLDRVNKFNNFYIQEQKESSDTINVLQDKVTFIYYVNNDKLLYTYNVYYRDSENELVTDIGSRYLIDQDGKIIE